MLSRTRAGTPACWLRSPHASSDDYCDLRRYSPVATAWISSSTCCLSVPAIYDKVERHARVTVRAMGRDGEVFEFEAEGLESVCVQHEMDHLEGHVFVEYLSRLKRDRIKNKLLKKAREEQDKQGLR